MAPVTLTDAMELAREALAEIREHASVCDERWLRIEMQHAQSARDRAELMDAVRRLHDRWWSVAVSLIVALIGIVGFLLAAYVLPAKAHAADAPGLCAPADEVAAGLAARFDERPVAMGRLGDEALLVMFASPGGTTVSFVVIRPDGLACLVGAAQDWHALPAKPGNDGPAKPGNDGPAKAPHSS